MKQKYLQDLVASLQWSPSVMEHLCHLFEVKRNKI